jgi:hypothetical protein
MNDLAFSEQVFRSRESSFFTTPNLVRLKKCGREGRRFLVRKRPLRHAEKLFGHPTKPPTRFLGLPSPVGWPLGHFGHWVIESFWLLDDLRICLFDFDNQRFTCSIISNDQNDPMTKMTQ